MISVYKSRSPSLTILNYPSPSLTILHPPKDSKPHNPQVLCRAALLASSGWPDPLLPCGHTGGVERPPVGEGVLRRPGPMRSTDADDRERVRERSVPRWTKAGARGRRSGSAFLASFILLFVLFFVILSKICTCVSVV